jgi:hypothetical protein
MASLRSEMAVAAADAERTARANAAEAKDMRETISKLQSQLAGLDGVCRLLTSYHTLVNQPIKYSFLSLIVR